MNRSQHHDRWLGHKSWHAAFFALVLAGCSSRDLPTQYGRQRPTMLETSVNGTDILAGMFTAAGHSVSSRRVVMTRSMASVDTIVWFPQDFDAPSPEFCQWADRWLSEGIGRTLVYVGADFEASWLYWHKMAARAEPEDQTEYKAREAAAKMGAGLERPHRNLHDDEAEKKEDDGEQSERPKNKDQKSRDKKGKRSKAKPKKGKHEKDTEEKDPLHCAWFTIEPSKVLYFSSPTMPGATPESVLPLEGPWAKGLDPARSELQLHEWLQPRAGAQQLLELGKYPFVSQLEAEHWADGRIILVANGSFLLNLPLVNHEHRKLAGKLVEAVGPGGKVVFLVSGPGGPPIDPEESDRSIWQVFGAWPLNAILLQLAVIGVIFCFARWPIFGRPRQPPPVSTSDFGKHVAAVGELLRRTHDRAFARAKLPDTLVSPPEPAEPAEKPG